MRSFAFSLTTPTRLWGLLIFKLRNMLMLQWLIASSTLNIIIYLASSFETTITLLCTFPPLSHRMIKFKHHQQTNCHDYLNLDLMHICIPKACIVGCPRFSSKRRTKTPTTVTFYCSFFSGPNSYPQSFFHSTILFSRRKVSKHSLKAVHRYYSCSQRRSE